MVGRNNPTGRRQRIGLAQHDVGQRDRQIPHREAHQQISEIDDSDDPIVGGGKKPVIRHQQIVVIEVIVDRTAPQLTQHGLGLSRKLAQRLVDPLAKQRILDQPAMALDHLPAPRQVPVQLPMDRRMVEIGQAPIELSQPTSQIGEEPIRVVAHLPQRPPWEKGDQPNKVNSGLPTACWKCRQRHLAEPLPSEGRTDPRSDPKRIPRLPQVGHHCLLGLKHRPGLQPVRNLQDVAGRALDRDPKVLVAIARQWIDRRLDPIPLPQEPLRFPTRHPRCLQQHRHAFLPLLLANPYRYSAFFPIPITASTTPASR